MTLYLKHPIGGALINRLHAATSALRQESMSQAMVKGRGPRYESIDAVARAVVAISPLAEAVQHHLGRGERVPTPEPTEETRPRAWKGIEGRPLFSITCESDFKITGDGFRAALEGFRVTRPHVLPTLTAAPGYERLTEVLTAAHDQAAFGKGKERHANDLPFHEQRMQQISQMLGSPAGMAYQVAKKVAEGLELPTLDRQKAELLGAINYLAGIVIFLEDQTAKAAGGGYGHDPQ